MQGAIIIIPYHVPKETVEQAQRLKFELENLGVKTEIVDDGFLRSYISNNDITCEQNKFDFIVYLDKDKYLSNELTQKGYRLFNSHDSIRVCDDKGETYLALAGKGVNLPNTIFGALCYRNDLKVISESADQIIEKLSLPIVVKESFGSLGTGVYKADTKEELLEIMEKVRTKPHIFAYLLVEYTYKTSPSFVKISITVISV